MKTPSDQLFKFIQSLDSYEKAFIKRCFSAEPNTKNEKLFAYLSSRIQYDEKKLLKSSDFVNQYTIKQSKHQLYNYLLKKLELYYSETDEEQKLYKLLFQIRLLRKKKNFDKAFQLLDLAIKKTKESDFFLIQMQLQNEQELLAIAFADNERYQKVKLKNDTHIDTLYAHYKEDRYCRLCKNELDLLAFNNEYEKIKTLYNEITAKKNNESYFRFPDQLQLKFDFIEYFCLLLMHDYSNSKKSIMEFLNRFERTGNSAYERTENLLMYIVNGAALSIRIKDKTLLNELERKADTTYESLPLKEKNNSIITYYYAIKSNVIGFYVANQEYGVAKTKAEATIPLFLSEFTNVYTKKVFLGNLSQIYLCCDEPKKALQYYNLTINNPKLRKIRDDITYINHIVGLAIFYELGSNDNMEAIIRHCMNSEFLSRQSAIYNQLVLFFNELTKLTYAHAIRDSFGSMIKNIDTVIKTGTDKESLLFLENIEIYYWLNNKLTRFNL